MTYVYPGAMHIHTLYSDGTGTIKDIAKAAKKAGLKWIIITDHNSLEGLHNSEEGWYDGVAVIIGKEISPEYSDHYIALGLKEVVSHDLPPEEYIKQVHQQGGIGFVAHPDESIERQNSYKPLRWTDWSIKGFDGIEIWNQLSDWVDNYNTKNALLNYFFKNHTLTGPTKNTLKWWDDLNKESKSIVPAVGGVDAHALVVKFLGLPVKIFPYKDSFKTVTNALFFSSKMSDDFETAKQQILQSLKGGNNIIVNRAWSRGNNFPIYYIEDKEHRVFAGGTITTNEKLKLVVKLPKEGLIRLIYDGQLVWEYEGSKLEFDKLDVGKYRVEAYYNNKPWVFTNPINVIES